MGEVSGIEWTDATWNPWYGCHKVSEACKNCYMFRDMKRYGRDPNVVVRSKTMFTAPLEWKEPRKVFTCSWSDWFIEEADAWRDEAWAIIRRTPHLTYQILTKRPERIVGHLPADWGSRGYQNVWLGVTIEKDEHQHRYPTLCKVPARVRFASCEPLLDDVQFMLMPDWVIVGSESGPQSRETRIEWVRSMREQCAEAGVPFFLKQLNVSGILVKTPALDGIKHVSFPTFPQESQHAND